MKKVIYTLIAILTFLCLPNFATVAHAEEMNTSAKAALLYDYKSGTEVYAKNH